LKIFIILITICASLQASVYQKVDEYSQKRSDYSQKKKIQETKKLVQKYPKSITAYIPYINLRSRLPILKVELQNLYKSSKSPVYQYLSERLALQGLSYKPSDMAKKEKIFKKLEAIVNENSSIKEEGLFDLHRLAFDHKKRFSIAQKLYKMKKSASFKKLYASSLLKTSKKDILNLCYEGIKEKKPHLNFCKALPKLLSINKISDDNDFKKIKDELDLLLKKSKDVALLKDLFSLFSRLDMKEKSYQVAHKIVKKDKIWFPHPYYKDVMKLKSIDDYILVRKIGEINRNVDFEQRAKELETYAYDNTINKHINFYALTSLARAYLNPAFNRPAKALNSLEDALRAGDKSFSTVKLYVETSLETKSKYDDALKWLLKVEKQYISKDQTKETSYYSSDVPFQEMKILSLKDRWSNHFFLKGRLFEKLSKKTKAYNSFTTSYSIQKNSDVSYKLFKLSKKKRPLEAFDWGMRSVALIALNPKEDKEKLLKRESKLQELINKNFSDKISFIDIKKSYLKMYENEINTEQEEKHPLIGKVMPTAKRSGIDGKKYDWSKLKGKNVIVSFWATWCTPCFQEMAVLNKMAKNSKFKDVKIVGICTDGLKNKRKVKKILKKAKISYDIVLSDGEMMKSYKAAAIPANFFVNKKGVIFDTEVGYSRDFEKKVKSKFLK